MELEQEPNNRYGLIGRQIAYSFSRNYFSKKFEKENIDASYVNFDVANVEELRDILQNTFVKGFNVTIPYKEAIIPMLNELDEHSTAIGAVNTVHRDASGKFVGYNTDFIGFRDSLLELFGTTILSYYISNKSIQSTYEALILGTGGASKGVHYALSQLGIRTRFVSRKRTKENLTYEDLNEDVVKNFKFIINTTPLGTHPETDSAPSIPYHYLNDAHIVYDLVYNPAKTKFLNLAEKQGATIINGLRMLELQAEASWSIWND